jgi:Histidinol-phosphate/aromatic aminotransferase and cobyric acid decarboxylase
MPTGQPELRFRPGVLAGAAYVPPSAGLDRGEYIRLDLNEATGPLSPAVAEAIARHVRDRGVYAYPDETDLRAAIAAYCGVPEARVLPTNGSDQAIDICLRAFLGPGDTMLVARPEFPIFGLTADLLQATTRGVPYGPDLTFPYDAFRAALAERPDLIVVINPNNPTGTPVDATFIEEVVRDNPTTPVIVDEAYYEFTGATVVPLLATYPNLIVLRTFSKAFAMAGLRLGYVVAHEAVIAQLAKVRKPFDVNALAVVAGQAQLAHLDDVRVYVKTLMEVVKPATVAFFERHGVPIWPGAANFVLVRPADCAAVVAALRAERILVRPMSAPALSGMFRMGIGTEAEMARVMEVYAGLLATGAGAGSEP